MRDKRNFDYKLEYSSVKVIWAKPNIKTYQRDRDKEKDRNKMNKEWEIGTLQIGWNKKKEMEKERK
jgi:hypothetical protein